MFETSINPPSDADMVQLEEWRANFGAADLEIPSGGGTATAVARRKDGSLIGSLSASIILAASLDPFLRDPQAGRGETLSGLFALTRSLEYQAQLNGASASFIAIPNLLPDYQTLMAKLGFDETAQHCKLYRHLY